tara:strand:+ start:72 stop:557 length:486 start_codon:yes stop_codon:yes gene_type:complete
MLNKKDNNILIVILSLLTIFLISAFAIEYIFGHQACKLCIYQRYPYFISIFLIFNILLIKKYTKQTLLTLSLVSLIGSILAFYHFGIEQGFLNESFICESQNLSKDASKEEILRQLKENTISCKNVTFRIFGLSLASINTIFSFLLFCIFIKIYKNYEINK